MPYLEVFYGKKWRKWGMAVSSSGVMQQKTEAHAEIGLDPAWLSAPLVEQIQSLRTAYQTCLLKGIPAGSLARSILKVACAQAAKNAVSRRWGRCNEVSWRISSACCLRTWHFKTMRRAPTWTS